MTLQISVCQVSATPLTRAHLLLVSVKELAATLGIFSAPPGLGASGLSPGVFDLALIDPRSGPGWLIEAIVCADDMPWAFAQTWKSQILF